MSFLEGKKLVIFGYRNQHSLAWAAAQASSQFGAEVAFAIEPGERNYDKSLRLLNSHHQATVHAAPCDVTNQDSIKECLADLSNKLGGSIDGVLHAVAFADRETIGGSFLEGLTKERFMHSLDVSAYSLCEISAAAKDYFPDTGGSIITLSYLGAIRAVPNYNLMGVAKATLEANVRYLAADLGKKLIRVNAISAGPVKTIAASAIGGFNKILQEVENNAPLGRNIKSIDVGNASAFLFSDLAQNITAQTIYVDAGYSQIQPGPQQ